MRNLLVALMVVFLLLSSPPAEAGIISSSIKALKELALEVSEHPLLYYLGLKSTKKVLEKNTSRDEKETTKEPFFEGASVPFWNGDEHVLFPHERSVREAVKCEDNKQKMLAGFYASVHERPDLNSKMRGEYNPGERICVKNKMGGWRMTTFGWLEEKEIGLPSEN